MESKPMIYRFKYEFSNFDWLAISDSLVNESIPWFNGIVVKGTSESYLNHLSDLFELSFILSISFFFFIFFFLYWYIKHKITGRNKIYKNRKDLFEKSKYIKRMLIVTLITVKSNGVYFDYNRATAFIQRIKKCVKVV